MYKIWTVEKKKSFFCPNGHQLVFVVGSDSDQLKKKIDDLEKKLNLRDEKIRELVLNLEAADDVIRREKARADELLIALDLARSERST